MKIYQYQPTKFIRLQIAQQKQQTEYLTLIDCTMIQVKEMVKSLIESQNISPFNSGHKTSINIREAIGAKNGKSESISFRGLSPNETMKLIIKHIDKKQKA